jgi:hypothetical protein
MPSACDDIEHPQVLHVGVVRLAANHDHQIADKTRCVIRPRQRKRRVVLKPKPLNENFVWFPRRESQLKSIIEPQLMSLASTEDEDCILAFAIHCSMVGTCQQRRVNSYCFLLSILQALEVKLPHVVEISA